MSTNTSGKRQDAQSGVFDLSGTMKRLGGDPDLLAELVALFDEDAPLWLNRIAQGVAQQKSDEVRHAAHALRGLAANFGPAQLTGTLLKLEEQAADGDLKQAAGLLSEARQETSQLQTAIAPHGKQSN